VTTETSTSVLKSPNRHTRCREKVFGEGRPIPLDRNAKSRIMVLARALTRRTGEGKHYGVLTAKFLGVLEALLWGFHNARTGLCFPSYETIAQRADCARSTVYEAIHALERAGILTWVNRIKRVREWGVDLFGRAENRWRVVRTSNGYAFIDPKKPARPPDSSKSEKQTGTPIQDFSLPLVPPVPTPKFVDSGLEAALVKLGSAIRPGAGRTGS
jgi:hypothetical protein